MTKHMFGVVAFLTLAAPGIVAQSPLDRGPTRGFDVAVIPSISLGFNAIRVWQKDTVACQADQSRCVSYAMGNAPNFVLDVTVPLGRYFGLSVAGTVGQPQRVTCVQDNSCQATSSQRLTVLRGSGMLLFRLKPQAPVFLGLGYAASRANPGSLVWQDSATVEKGPVAELAFDFALGEQVGFRVAWWNYWFSVKSDLGTALGVTPCSSNPGDGCFTAESTAHDQMFSFGARIRLLK